MKKLSDLKTHFEVTFGFPLQDIIDYAEKKSIDMIVMGTLGRKDVLNKLLGSITYGVIEHTGIPVLAIPDNCRPTEIKEMVLANDFKKATSEKALGIVASVALLYKAFLKILNITKDADGAELNTEEVLNLARAFKRIPHTYAFAAGKKSESDILNFLEKESPDLFVIISRKHGFIFNLFRLGVTSYMVNRISIPMLAVQS